MRKVLLVIAVIGASFAGGAAVNGPGLERLRSLLRPDPAAAAAEGQSLPMAGAGVALESPDPDRPDGPFPAAPLPELVDENSGAQVPRAESSERVEAAPTSPGKPGLGAGILAMLPKLEPPRTEPGSDGDSSASEGTTAGSDVPAPPTPVEAPTPPPVEPLRPAPAGTGNAATESTTVADPAVARTQGDPGPAAAGDWATLRRRLAEAGVSRYWIEGEPGGSVRLRCVIPLAGERAVAQQFEAEADDESAAAELALRRIALWQAAGGNGSP